MNILFELLNELKYETKESFSFNVTINNEDINSILTPFVSVEYPCQTYIVVEVRNDKLDLVNNEFFKAIALSFRQADFHESDMDKNTTLLVSSVRADNETLNSQAKIKIEDDPYYFKKYVFSYTNANEQKAIQYLEYKKAEKGLNFSYIEEISEYLLKAEYFKEYKEKEDNLSTYSYFIELATKIPAFPLNITNSQQIKSVDVFLKEQLQSKTINTSVLDQLISGNINFKEDSVESILLKYESLLLK